MSMENNQPDKEQAPTNPVSPIRSYFANKDIVEAMNSLTEEDMLRRLVNLEQTEYWPAILKYNQMRLQHSQAAINIGDPFKDPTNLARNQGVMIGLLDLQNAVVMMKDDKEKSA